MAKEAPMSQNSVSASTKAPAGYNTEKMVLRARTTSKREYLKMDSDEEDTISAKKPKAKTRKKITKTDAKKPKKPPTAFFYFLENFRKEYKEQNPDVKSMRDVGKACGEKWKTMTYEEKVQYYDMATEKRAEFDRTMIEYNKRKGGCGDEEAEEDSEFDE